MNKVKEEQGGNVCGCSTDWGWIQCCADHAVVEFGPNNKKNPNPNCRQKIWANPSTNFDYYVGYSQALFDPYSLDHFTSGIILYLLSELIIEFDMAKIAILGTIDDDVYWAFLVTSLIHLMWEIVENTPCIVAKFRDGGKANDAAGDSVANTVGDQLIEMAGFWVGYGIHYGELKGDVQTERWIPIVTILGVVLGLQLISEILFSIGLVSTGLVVLGCKNAADPYKDVEQGKAPPKEDDDQKEESDGFIHKVGSVVKSGFKHLTEEAFTYVANRFQNDVALGEQALLAVSAQFNLSHKAPTCIPHVSSYNGIHDDMEQVVSLHIFNELGIVKETQGMQGFYKSFEGKPRTIENYKKIWEKNCKLLGMDDAFPSFPERLDKKAVIHIITSNPFLTMVLDTTADGKIVYDATENSTNEFGAMIFGNLRKGYSLSKVVIEPDLSDCYIDIEGKRYTDDTPEEKWGSEWDKAVMKWCTCMLYQFEYVHACLHVYAYIMLGAAQNATSQTKMDHFMNQYQQKILTKYVEVAKLLIAKGGLVVGGYWPCKSHDHAVRNTTKVFQRYAQAKNSEEWFNGVFLSNNEALIKNEKVLKQCRPYVKMMQEMAKNTVDHISKDENQQIDAALVKYLSNTGGESNEQWFKMTCFREWIECQSFCGILHGNTLSISRLVFTPYNRFDGDWDSTLFSQTAATYGVVAGTLLGLEEHHAINQTATIKDTMFEQMMRDYQEKTHLLQHQYWDNLDEDVKQMYGWLFSVWGPNMLNQTQLTITTYV